MTLNISLFQAAVLALCLYGVYVAVWRLYFSPIAKFPGRKLAALTIWYEFYWEFFQGGRYTWEIEKMHEEYGPIVRINPYEIHVKSSDPAFIAQLYPNVGKRVDKWWFISRIFNSPQMTFATIPHSLHRKRRSNFSSFFSKASIRRQESLLQSIVDKICNNLEKALRGGKNIDVAPVYASMTAEFITEYCFGYSLNIAEKKDFGVHHYKIQSEPMRLTPILKTMPWIVSALEFLPTWIVKLISQNVVDLQELSTGYSEAVSTVLSSPKDQPERPTIFHTLRDDPELPPAEKSLQRLTDEAKSLVGAGTLTSAHTMAAITFHILSNPDILEKLLVELETAIPDLQKPAPILTLEGLPYLSAVVLEGLRINSGTSHRLSRVHPDTPIVFKDWVIPPGTPVGISPMFVHKDPEVFPEPYQFRPERWLEASEKTHEAMVSRMSAFGHGSRKCAGLNLAMIEMHMGLAAVFRRFGRKMDLFDTIRERDVDAAHDFFIPFPRDDSKGIRVALKP